jgi:hypothetical protein
MADMDRYGCAARVSYRRGKQWIMDWITLDRHEMYLPPEVRDKIIETELEIAIAACQDCAQTPSERARKLRIRRHLRSCGTDKQGSPNSHLI